MYDRLENTARDMGIDLFGVADLATAQDLIRAQGGEYTVQFPRAISIGIRLLNAVVDELHRHEDPPVIFTYRGLYNSVNASLDRAALLIAKEIQETGFSASPIPASQVVSQARLEGSFSHKLAAHLSGLGWIGRSCLLINPSYGPRVRFATVLTNAPLRVGAPAVGHCGDCRKCVDVCPVKAFTGLAFSPSEPVEARFKVHLCMDYMNRRKQRFGEGICGLCVYICPHGMMNKHTSSSLAELTKDRKHS